jgi:hypothetical protein
LTLQIPPSRRSCRSRGRDTAGNDCGRGSQAVKLVENVLNKDVLGLDSIVDDAYLEDRSLLKGPGVSPRCYRPSRCKASRGESRSALAASASAVVRSALIPVSKVSRQVNGDGDICLVMDSVVSPST